MCSGGGRQQWRKQRQREGRQQSTKKWQQRCSKYYFKCNILNITRLRRKEQGAAVCGRVDSGNGVDSQRQQRRGQATVAEAEAAQGQTTINQKAVAIAAEMVLVAAAVAEAAAMATAAMAATTWQPWGRPMWVEVIFHSTYYYLHNSTYICVTIVRRLTKRKSVLNRNTKFVFCKTHVCIPKKHICVFNQWGLFVECTFGWTLIFSKTR